jgi:Tfp pilus assembly protein FimV
MLIAGAVHAAELGDPRVSSHIGQQLVADIELTLLEDANTPVQARLASPEVYSGAGIAVPPVLSSLNLTVMRRDGRQFLHATTLRPVDADHLHLYLELSDHGQRVVRLATLWLTPDPNPAPVALPAPAPVLAALAPAPAPARVHAAAEPAPPALAWAKRPVPAPVHAEPPAAKTVPPPPPAPAPKLLPLPVHAAARPAACTPQSGEAEACVALGAKNAELRARIGQLEQRVKGLQASLGAGKLAAPQPVAPKPEAPKPQAPKPQGPKPEAPKPAAQKPSPPAPPQETRPLPRPAGPAPISSIKPLVPHKPKAPAPADDDPPWGAIGGGLAVLAALGGAAALVRVRRKRPRNVDIPADPGVLPRLRERFFARNGVKAQTDPVAERAVEPSLE